MASYKIVCTEQTDCSRYGHILAVGTGPGRANQRWTVSQVWDAIDRGHGFYTEDSRGNTAWVDKFRCGCGRGSLRSRSDHTVENNLDSLRVCSFS